MRFEIPAKSWDSVRAQLATVCPKCGTPAGHWCYTPRGALRTELHAARYTAAMVRLRELMADES